MKLRINGQPVHYRGTDSMGYEVSVGKRKPVMILGTVRKHEKSYNLTRYLVVRYWTARLPDGTVVGHKGTPNQYDTRMGATIALADANRANPVIE